MSRSAETRARIQAAALDAFERDGFDTTPVAKVAAAAGVSEMTVFRHFATKAALVVDDPFDPLLAEAVRAQPSSLAPLPRAIAGIEMALSGIDPVVDDTTRRRVALIARTPELEHAMGESTARTRDAICRALVADGTDPTAAAVAAAAVIAAMSAALIEDARNPANSAADATVMDVVWRALQVLAGRA